MSCGICAGAKEGDICYDFLGEFLFFSNGLKPKILVAPRKKELFVIKHDRFILSVLLYNDMKVVYVT